MTDATTEFFSALEARRHEPLLEKESGTLRFDLISGKRTTRWLIEIENGTSRSRIGTARPIASYARRSPSSTGSRADSRTP